MSHPPSSSISTLSSRELRNLDEPLFFDQHYGPVTDWYEAHKTIGSTAIRQAQLRKEICPPVNHEFVLIYTQGGQTYRVERSRDKDEDLLETMSMTGVMPIDTIARVQPESTSWKKLHDTSYCVIDLHWGDDDKPVDLKLILQICYRIHNESGKRYKLLTHNCYFFAQTILVISVRKTVVCGVELLQALERGMSGIAMTLCRAWCQEKVRIGCNFSSLASSLGDRTWELGRELGRNLGKELGKELGRELDWELDWELSWELDSLLGFHLSDELSRKLCDVSRKLSSELVRNALEYERKLWQWEALNRRKGRWNRHVERQNNEQQNRQKLQNLQKELWKLSSREQKWLRQFNRWKLREQTWNEERNAELRQCLRDEAYEERALKWERVREQERDRKEELRQFNRWRKLRERTWNEERDAELRQCLREDEEWALEWERVQEQERGGERWDDELEKQLEKRWEELQDLERKWLRTLSWTLDFEFELALELAQGALVVVLEQAFRGELAPDCRSSDTLIEALPNNLAGVCASWLIRNLEQAVERDPFCNTTISKVIEFPASFTVFSKVDPTAPDEPITRYEDLEEYMKVFLARDVQIIPDFLGSKEELKAEILDSMKHTWHLVRQSFRNLLD